MAETTIGNLTLGAVDGTTLFEQERTVSGSQVSEKVTSSSVANFVGTSAQFAGLSTTAKDLVGAINEAAQSGGGASVIQLTQAEYTALSTAEKMNGSIYKITDNAKMYCLDEEYHPVKELTTAQYNALTTAEKNNGTIYIRTDAETTGEDIPVNTLTPNTSINSAINACFGRTGSDIPVSSSDNTSVADKIDELESNITTQTVDGISWTVKRNGKFYEMWADITIDASAVTPTQWGSLYVYRNSKTTYLLPVTLAKKVCDFSYSSGATATMTVYYTDLSSQENERTSADAIRATQTSAPIIVHKYIRGYVN